MRFEIDAIAILQFGRLSPPKSLPKSFQIYYFMSCVGIIRISSLRACWAWRGAIFENHRWGIIWTCFAASCCFEIRIEDFPKIGKCPKALTLSNLLFFVFSIFWGRTNSFFPPKFSLFRSGGPIQPPENQAGTIALPAVADCLYHLRS